MILLSTWPCALGAGARRIVCGALLGVAPSLAQESVPAVEGLRPGESVVAIAPARRGDEWSFARGRVLDATLGVPLEDVLIEAWTEDGTEPGRVPLLLDRVRTARDGSFGLRAISGSRKASNFRFSRAGFESTVLGSWPEEETFLQARWSLEGRVVDFEGRPIPGAIVGSRQCCPHAVSATATRTDASGRFRLPDFPANPRQEADLEIVAAAHGPIARIGASEARERSSRSAWQLPLAQPRNVRLLDHEGQPLRGRRIVRTIAPTFEVWTSHYGHVQLPPPIAQTSESFEVSDGAGQLLFPPAMLPPGVLLKLRALGPDSEPPRPTGTLTPVTVRCEIPAGARPPAVQILTASGYWYEGFGEHRLPQGGAVLVLGEPFDGWRQEVRELEVGVQPLEVALMPEREPRVKVQLAPGIYSRLAIQAGTDSRTFWDVEIDGEPFEHHVPAGVPVLVLAERPDGWNALARPSPSGEGTDLLEVDLLHVRSPDSPDPTSVTLFVPSEDGQPGEFSGWLDVAGESTERLVSDGAATATFSLRLGQSFSANLFAEGCSPLMLRGRVEAVDQRIPVSFVRRCQLSLRGDVAAATGYRGRESADAGELLLDVAPGALSLQIERRDGSQLLVELELRAGEHRQLIVRGE